MVEYTLLNFDALGNAEKLLLSPFSAMTCYKDAYGVFAKGIHETFCQKRFSYILNSTNRKNRIIRLILVVSDD